MISFLILIKKHPSKADTGNIPESNTYMKRDEEGKEGSKTTYGAEAPQTKPRIVFKAEKPERKTI